MREFRIAQQLAPDLAQAYNGSGDVFRLEGKLDEAIQDYKRALQIDPDYAGARKNLGWASALKQSQSQQ